MFIFACSAGCPRGISVSTVPGGNPDARRDPQSFAVEWTRCDACGRFTCDRCLARQRGHCGCGRPARLLHDEERVRVAAMLAQSRPASPPQTAPTGAQADVLLRYLSTIGSQIDASLQAGDTSKADTLARHAARSFQAPPGALSVQDVHTLMRWGEQYYRWRLWEAGAEFWRAAATFAAAQRLPHADFERAASIAGAMLLFAGRPPASAAHAAELLAMLVRVFGPEHVLVRDVVARLVPPATAQPQAPTPPRVAPQSPPATDQRVLKKLGFFQELKHGDRNGPSLREQVRPAPLPYADYLVAYLRGSPMLIAAMGRAVDVLDPAVGRIGTPSIRTDGVWAWPDDLAHYVARYNVELPPAFIEHGLACQWTLVTEASLDLKALKLP